MEAVTNMESTMEEKIQDLFSKHFNRIKNDLTQIKGVTPVMMVVISNGLRNLEEDVLDEMENKDATQI